VSVSLAIIVLGNLYVFTDLSGFFDLDFTLLSPGSLSAFIDYLIIIALAVILYVFVIDKDGPVIKKIRGFNLSFEHANYIFMIFTVIMAVYFVFIV